ncbi:MAG: transcriptional repressor NrdR [Myxococcales bacterium]|nr:transcriptional repressor NrdR [Myxococcales bacterium]
MKCPGCGHLENKVIDSRLSQDGKAIRRRRECAACRHRFTTYERAEDTTPLVVKKDGRREPFEREKLKSGILRACEKRPVGVDEIVRFVDEVERRLSEKGEREVSSTWLGEEVMRFLHDLDEVAYVRFASVYRSFRDLSEFMGELKELIEERGRTAKKRGKS